jgi:hypothetical protein
MIIYKVGIRPGDGSTVSPNNQVSGDQDRIAQEYNLITISCCVYYMPSCISIYLSYLYSVQVNPYLGSPRQAELEEVASFLVRDFP